MKDNTSSDYGGKIQGTGEFIKSGSDKLLLTADISASEGKTTGGKLGGDVEVEGEAVSGGSGVISGTVTLNDWRQKANTV